MPTPESKTCTKCGETKPLEDFGRDKSKKSGRRSDCKMCHAALVNGRYHDDPAVRVRQREAQRLAYAADPERFKRKVRVWRQDNPEKHVAISAAWTAKNREKSRAYKRKYNKANPDVGRRGVRKRRALKRAAEHIPYTSREIFDRDGGHCKLFGIELDYDKPYGFHIDHIVPLSLLGPDTRLEDVIAEVLAP